MMTPQGALVTVREGADKDQVLGLFHRHRIEKVLVVDKAFELRGMITVKDIQKAHDNPIRVQGRARRAARRRGGRHRRSTPRSASRCSSKRASTS